jgi:hypothetical protein
VGNVLWNLLTGPNEHTGEEEQDSSVSSNLSVCRFSQVTPQYDIHINKRLPQSLLLNTAGCVCVV